VRAAELRPRVSGSARFWLAPGTTKAPPPQGALASEAAPRPARPQRSLPYGTRWLAKHSRAPQATNTGHCLRFEPW
jgi:hypothetical protein